MENTSVDVNIVCKLPNGMRDFGPHEVYFRENLISRIKKHFELYGGLPIETPVMECMETVKNLYGEEFNKLVYTLNDIGEELLLRYDLTVPCARYVVNNALVNFKRYQIGKVYRRDHPQLSKGRYREFLQVDFDIIGSDYQTLIQDTEILSLMKDILVDLLGFDNNKKFTIKLNNKKILFDVLSSIGEDPKNFSTICSSLDKLDKMSWEDVKLELNHKKIDSLIINKLEKFIELIHNEEGVVNKTNNKLTLLTILRSHQFISQETYHEMMLLFNNLAMIQELSEYITFDPLLSRGLDYYSGIIYEAIYHDITIMPSSIAAGGRYDHMLENLGNKGTIPAIGLSLGFERIFTIISDLHSEKKIPSPDIFVATVGPNLEAHKLALVIELRKMNLHVDMSYHTAPKMRQQYESVFSKKIPVMLILGETEIKNQTLKIKIMEKHEEYEMSKVEAFKFIVSYFTNK
jgi:histidyl-tRNA synthetase